MSALLLATASVSATISIPADFREIVGDATLIVRGHVTDVRGVVTRDAGIDSIATVAVESVIKGAASDFISVRVPGGVVGRTRMLMVGAPRFDRGDRAVLFLKRGADNTWRPVGLAMGVYRVQVEPLTRRLVVNPPIVASRTAAAGRVVRGDIRRKPLPVQEFESLVRLVMASPGSAIRRGGRP